MLKPIKAIVFLLFFIELGFSQTKSGSDQTAKPILSENELEQIVKLVSNKTIVGLGEGTHGTKEFNLVRAAISRKLIEEKGFNYICLENSFGEVCVLNKKLLNGDDVDDGIKSNLLSIYQTEDISMFLKWLQKHNAISTKNKVNLVGIDFFELQKTYGLFISSINEDAKNPAFTELNREINFQDSIQNNQLDRHERFTNSILRCYALLDSLTSNRLIHYTDTASFLMYSQALSIKFKMYHEAVKHPDSPVLNRDSAMAAMVCQIKVKDPSAKILVWAHNLHISKKYMFGIGKNGGGMGGYIEKLFPQEYLAIATTTSKGNYNVTKDKYPTRFNRFIVVRYPDNPKGSLGHILEGNKSLQVINLSQTTILPEKVIYLNPGYNYSPRYTPTFNIKLKDYFDVLVHIPHTFAPVLLEK